jgi:Alpha/beta hydrolase family
MRQTRRTGGQVAIAYDIKGSGPLVVFLHGIGGNRRNWEGQVDYFGVKLCAVAWDARGYGASDDSPQTLQFRDYADDLARLLDHLGSPRHRILYTGAHGSRPSAEGQPFDHVSDIICPYGASWGAGEALCTVAPAPQCWASQPHTPW